MPLVKMILGARYQFDNTLVKNGEVIEVDNRTRNRLVKGGHFKDVAEHERPAFVPLPEDDDPAPARGGQSLDDIDDPSQTGANADKLAEAPDDGPRGARGTGQTHMRGNDEALNDRATEGRQREDADAERAEAEVD